MWGFECQEYPREKEKKTKGKVGKIKGWKSREGERDTIYLVQCGDAGTAGSLGKTVDKWESPRCGSFWENFLQQYIAFSFK